MNAVGSAVDLSALSSDGQSAASGNDSRLDLIESVQYLGPVIKSFRLNYELE